MRAPQRPEGRISQYFREEETLSVRTRFRRPSFPCPCLDRTFQTSYPKRLDQSSTGSKFASVPVQSSPVQSFRWRQRSLSETFGFIMGLMPSDTIERPVMLIGMASMNGIAQQIARRRSDLYIPTRPCLHSSTPAVQPPISTLVQVWRCSIVIADPALRHSGYQM